MNITIDETVFKDRINNFVHSKFDDILVEAFKKKTWPENVNGFGRDQLKDIIAEYINSQEFKDITNKLINDNVEKIIKEVIISEIKLQTKATIKALINNAILNIKEE